MLPQGTRLPPLRLNARPSPLFSPEEVCIYLLTPTKLTNQPTDRHSDNRRHYQLRADEPEIANQPKSGGTAPTIILISPPARRRPEFDLF